MPQAGQSILHRIQRRQLSDMVTFLQWMIFVGRIRPTSGGLTEGGEEEDRMEDLSAGLR
jgi:hypothetical protein